MAFYKVFQKITVLVFADKEENVHVRIQMKNLIKKIFGIDKIEAAKAKAEEELEIVKGIKQRHEMEAVEAEEKADLAKKTPKERATIRGEPYVAVLDTHVNKDNIRNGFFELDWNPEFIVQLKQAGYGFDGDPEEEIVDRWFRDLARNVLADEGQDTNRGMGFINVSKLGNGKASVE
jgi:hypothetical protein